MLGIYRDLGNFRWAVCGSDFCGLQVVVSCASARAKKYTQEDNPAVIVSECSHNVKDREQR